MTHNIYKFRCGFCGFISTRKGLRYHLGKEHVRNAFTNKEKSKGQVRVGYNKQSWWIRESFEEEITSGH